MEGEAAGVLALRLHRTRSGCNKVGVRPLRRTSISVLAALAVLVAIALAASPQPAIARATNAQSMISDGLGIRPGKIKHVWLIILENKSYDATFTGLNNNTYLWRQLPSQGILLKNYFGTGHFSFDNYISLASEQATQAD